MYGILWVGIYAHCLAWNAIAQGEIDHLTRSMPRQVGACIRHNEISTRALAGKMSNVNREVQLVYYLTFVCLLVK